MESGVKKLLGIVAVIILSYFFTPLQEPINNFVLSAIYGEPEVNIYISRNYVSYNLSEFQSWDEILFSVKRDIQAIVFRKYLLNKKRQRSV